MIAASTPNLERVPVSVYPGSLEGARAVARRMAEIIRSRAGAGRAAVLGLATGSTPLNVYKELIRMHREEGLDFSHVVTFNLDEYWPISHDRIQSYHTWMHERFFRHVNVPPENIHIPSGEVPEENIDTHCAEYEQAIEYAGGLDFQLLGIGRSGHVGFNEPGSSPDSRTRLVMLDKVTRKDAASDFFGEENVPESAITMGLETILSAREVALLAFGEHKAPIVRRAVEGEVSVNVAASFLQNHPRARFYLDAPAAADLTRMRTPWLIGDCHWDGLLQRRAVIWLARKLDKPILKLTDEDYAENGLGGLLHARGCAYDQNIKVFRRMMETITGWPGGKAGPRRVLVLSPHPDDDAISMGGVLARLAQHGHEVHVAYMVSGYLSVFDHDVQRYADFVIEFNRIFGLVPEDSESAEQTVDAWLHKKTPGDIDTPEVRALKGFIRKAEATDAATYSGVQRERIHFLDLPFYDTGTVQKAELSDEDIERVCTLYETTHPEMIFAAGDLSDPHGTHRVCLAAALEALERYVSAGGERPEVWLYRGAWQEWPPEEIDMAVPLSPDELRAKRFAIFRHESQKDRAMFPGPYDSREFWQRAEDRNMTTAATYDALGLPEYHALEAFARYPLQHPAHIEAQLTRA